jgi:hypothetical protein
MGTGTVTGVLRKTSAVLKILFSGVSFLQKTISFLFVPKKEGGFGY